METLILLFVGASVTYQLPSGLLSSLCYVESRHNPAAVHHDDGRGDSLGVCQIKLSTARGMGFKGTQKELMDPRTNVAYAAKYLHKQMKRYGDNIAHAVAAYNTGTFKPRGGGAVNQPYVEKVFKAWAQRK